MQRAVALFITGWLFCPSGSIAAEKTIAAKVKAVDATKNSIMLDELDLDVSRKTKITIEGKRSTLAEIKLGQQAKVIYDDELEVARSIVIGPEGEGDQARPTKTVHDKPADAMKAIQGEWSCVAGEQAGKPLTKRTIMSQDRRVTIKGNTLTMKRTQEEKKGTYLGKFEIDVSNGHFDFVGKGPTSNHTEWIGIYELKGDTLKLCYQYKNVVDVDRPAKFKTLDNKPTSVCYTFKRDPE